MVDGETKDVSGNQGGRAILTQGRAVPFLAPELKEQVGHLWALLQYYYLFSVTGDSFNIPGVCLEAWGVGWSRTHTHLCVCVCVCVRAFFLCVCVCMCVCVYVHV